MKKSIFALFAFAFFAGLAFAQPAGAVFCPDSTEVVYILELNLESECFDEEPVERFGCDTCAFFNQEVVHYRVMDLDDSENPVCSFPGQTIPSHHIGYPLVTNEPTYPWFPTLTLQTQAVCMTPGNRHRLYLMTSESCAEWEDFNDQLIINTEDFSMNTLVARPLNQPGDPTSFTYLGFLEKMYDFIAPTLTITVPSVQCADLNGDSFINTADLGILLSQYGFQCE